MSKKNIIILVVWLIIMGVALYFVPFKDDNAPPEAEPMSMDSMDNMMASPEDMQKEEGDPVPGATSDYSDVAPHNQDGGEVDGVPPGAEVTGDNANSDPSVPAPAQEENTRPQE